MEAAARLFREHGFDGVGVDAIMKEAGLTHGGFYGHFASKEELATEAITRAFAQGSEKLGHCSDLGGLVNAYLSDAHCADRIQEQAKPLLIPLIRGDRTALGQTGQEREANME